MKAIRKGNGKQFKVVADSKIEAGDVVVKGSLVGVAAYPIPAGETGVVERDGEFECVYDGAAANQGAKAYWDATNKRVTATQSTNTAIGYFALAAVSGDTVCRVILG